MPSPTFSPFEVVVIPFPFTDSAATKRRPALVISAKTFNQATGHVVLAMITTAQHSSWAGDVPLKNWKQTGLPKPSMVRLKLFTLDQRFIVRQLGHLGSRDKQQVRASLNQHILNPA